MLSSCVRRATILCVSKTVSPMSLLTVHHQILSLTTASCLRGSLNDTHGRFHNYLRISLSERCNLRYRSNFPPTSDNASSHNTWFAQRPCSNKTGKYATLTHVDASGKANMVDVSDKDTTSRVAQASAKVELGEEAYMLVKRNEMAKGDVIGTARIAGIQAAKLTSNFIPLCHQINLCKVLLDFKFDDETASVILISEVKTVSQTGVEMEALTACSIAALTIYDMCKAVTHKIVITDIKLLHKSGGKSLYQATEDDSSVVVHA